MIAGQHTSNRSRRGHPALRVLTILLLLGQLGSVAWLSGRIPYEHLSGGPDEPMHLSMSRTLAETLEWPSWDSPRVERYRNGGSYATGPSFGYWIEAVLLRLTGRDRGSGVFLFAVITLCASALAWRSPLAGLLCAATTTPQLIFLYSYVNADSWAIFIAFQIGLSIALLHEAPDRPWRVAYFLLAGAASFTARQHLLPLAFVTAAYTLLALRHQVGALLARRSTWAAIAAALVVASWWPLTSYVAHDDPFLGLTARQQAVEHFGPETPLALGMPWSELDLGEYTRQLARSAYGYWGWAMVPLPGGWYPTAALLAVAWLAVCVAAWPRFSPLFLVLPLMSFGLMLVFAVHYDYQWQGKYMLPSFLLVCGAAAGRLGQGHGPRHPQLRVAIGVVLLATALTNGLATSSLWTELSTFDRTTPDWKRGQILYETGDTGWARHHFERSISLGEDRESFTRIRLSKIATAEGKHAEAVAHARRAVALDPQDRAARRTLARALAAMRTEMDEEPRVPPSAPPGD